MLVLSLIDQTYELQFIFSGYFSFTSKDIHPRFAPTDLNLDP